MAQRYLSSFAIAILIGACQVGNPLVDKFEQPDGELKLRCPPPPKCQMLEPIETPDHAAEPIDLSHCTRLCNDTELDFGKCPMAPQPEEALPISGMCRDLEFQPAADAAELDLSGTDWVNMNFRVHAERPLRVVWSGGKLQHVFIELNGPITLQLDQLEEFEDLRIAGGSTPAGTPRVELANIQGAIFSVGAEDQPFSGELKMRALHLLGVDVRAANLSFESVLLDQASLRADSLTLTDVTLKHAMLDAKLARMSVFSVEDSTLNICAEARLVDGSFARSALSSCADAVIRLYNANLVSCSVDGTYELDDASLENVRLGVNDTTRILAYNSRVSSDQLCSHLEMLALGRSSVIKCSGCEGKLDNGEAPTPCVFDESKEVLLMNYCPPWLDLEELPVCEEAVPSAPDRVR